MLFFQKVTSAIHDGQTLNFSLQYTQQLKCSHGCAINLPSILRHTLHNLMKFDSYGPKKMEKKYTVFLA